MDAPRWNHKPMHCMVCAHAIPLHRRATGSWFCSTAHKQLAEATGLLEKVRQHRAQSDWDHDRNPIDATSCYFCGYTIGPVRRVQGHIYCSEECFLAHHVHQKSEPNTGRRDALVAASVMTIAGAMLLYDRRGSGPAPGAAAATTPSVRPLLADWTRLIPQKYDAGLSFKTEEGLALWLAARDAWRIAGNAIQPAVSMLYAGIREFRSGSVELTTRGGAGLLVNAAENLASYHFVALRPIYAAGRIIDYSLDYGTRAASEIVSTSSRRLRLGAALAGRPETTFRIEKKGYNLEAYLEVAPGNRRWLNKWEEKSLPDGRVGLYVGDGLRYSVLGGRIQADDAAV